MIIEESESPTSYKLICSSGYHSGQTELVFPAEAAHKKGGISATWLKKTGHSGFIPSAKPQASNTLNSTLQTTE